MSPRLDGRHGASRIGVQREADRPAGSGTDRDDGSALGPRDRRDDPDRHDDQPGPCDDHQLHGRLRRECRRNPGRQGSHHGRVPTRAPRHLPLLGPRRPNRPQRSPHARRTSRSASTVNLCPTSCSGRAADATESPRSVTLTAMWAPAATRTRSPTRIKGALSPTSANPGEFSSTQLDRHATRSVGVQLERRGTRLADEHPKGDDPRSSSPSHPAGCSAHPASTARGPATSQVPAPTPSRSAPVHSHRARRSPCGSACPSPCPTESPCHGPLPTIACSGEACP